MSILLQDQSSARTRRDSAGSGAIGVTYFPTRSREERNTSYLASYTRIDAYLLPLSVHLH